MLFRNWKWLRLFLVLKIGKYYLYGFGFEVFDNHKSVEYLFGRKEYSMRQRGWLEFVMSYDFS